DALLSLARRDDVEAITPLRESDILVLAKNTEEFAEHLTPTWPPFSTLETVHDRMQLVDAARRAGVPTPKTELLDTIDSWDRNRIVKGRFSIVTRDYVENAPRNRTASPPSTVYLEPGREPDVEELISAMGHVPIAQEFVSGTQYSFRALYNNGDPTLTSQKRLVRGMKYPRGPSVFHESVDIPELKELSLALLDELEWHGVASVQFIRDESGTFKLLEVNPRLWASLNLDRRAGVDYPYNLLRLARNQSIPANDAYRPGISTHILRGELVHLHSVLFDTYPLVDPPSVSRTLKDIAISVYTSPNFDYLSLDDPGPFVRDLLNMAETELLQESREGA
ncbi:MAG: ATP-grasp domain-containing protein, partial [Halodesulfurarchaeum sp.]